MENKRPKRDENRCKKHPKHQQSPGVCSVCLRKRLSQLSSLSSSRTTTATSASYYSSSLSSSSLSSLSSESSPPHVHHLLELSKSRSVAYSVRRRTREKGGEGKKEGGFWSKLLRAARSSGRKEIIYGDLEQSRTMRERVMINSSTKVH